MDCSCWGKKMPTLIFKRVCCCQPKTAAYIIGSVELIILVFVTISFSIKRATNPWYLYGHAFNDSTEFWSKIEDIPDSELPAPTYCFAAIVTILESLPVVTQLVITAMLIHGLRKDKLDFLRLWLWFRLVNVLDFSWTAINMLLWLPIEGPIFVFTVCTLAVCSMVVVRSHLYHVRLNDDFIALQESRNCSVNRGKPEDGTNEAEDHPIIERSMES